MKKILVSLTIILTVGLAGCAKRVLVQPTVDLEKYNTIAVLPFESDSFLSTVGHQMADEMVVILLQKAKGIEVIERTRIDALIQEQNLASQGYLNPDSAVAVGKILGVKGIVTGNIAFSVGDVRTTRDNEQRIATGIATVRFVDVETGKVVWAKREKSDYAIYKTMDEGVAYNIKTDHEMIQEIINDLARKLSEPFYPHYEYQF